MLSMAGFVASGKCLGNGRLDVRIGFLGQSSLQGLQCFRAADLRPSSAGSAPV
jgi:hypothetical protein